MEILRDDIGLLVFKAVSRIDTSELRLDGRSLRVLLEMDGKRTVFEVTKRLNLPLSELRPIIKKLFEEGLLELSEESLAKVDSDFFNYLLNQLALAVGPLAQVILEDAISELNSSIDNFPVTYLAELIDIISSEIPREEKRNLFRKNILNKMKEKGY